MLYKTILQHDRWGHAVIRAIYSQKFQKAGMSILGDAESYVKNSSVNLVIIYFYMSFTKKITIYSP